MEGLVLCVQGDRQLCSELKRSDSEAEQASKKAARMELLLQEEPGWAWPRRLLPW